MRRLSFSQIQTWKQCKRWWYNHYILKLPSDSDMCYANAGNVVHKFLQSKFDNNQEPSKDTFELLWKKYKLPDSKIANRQESYWEMCLTGMVQDITPTTTELKIFFEDFVCYIDTFDSKNRIITDWKTSTRTKVNEREYKEQLNTYCWMVMRKFGWVPRKCIVHYLKTNTTLEFEPDFFHIKTIEYNMNEIQKDIAKETKWEKCSTEPGKCPFFCPYKNVCFGKDNVINFGLHVKGNNIYIRGYESILLTKGLHKEFSYKIDGAHFLTSQWDGVVRLFNEKTYSVPIGFRNRLLKLLQNYCKYRDKTFNYVLHGESTPAHNVIKMPDKLSGITLRGYQEGAADIAITEKMGVLHLSVGSGKTEIGAEIIRRLGVKTLWLTHKIELLNQTSERLKERLGIEIGKIQGDNIDIKDVTVAMIPTLNNQLRTLIALQGVELVIVDECHHAKSRTWIKLLKLIKAKYRFGLSGSIPDKGETKMIESQLGDIIYEVDSSQLMDENYLARPRIIMKTMFNDSVRGSWKEVQEDFIIKNSSRNLEIMRICIQESERFTVIIVDRIAHGELLKNLIPNSIFINGQLNKKDRATIMEDARENKLRVLIGTVINEGIDLPQMDNIIIAKGGGVSIIPTIQAAGRVLRLNKNKGKKIFDFYDKGKYIEKHSKERMKIYKTYGEIEHIK